MWEVLREEREEREVIVLYRNVKLLLTSRPSPAPARELARLDLEAERGGGCDIIGLRGWFVRVESSRTISESISGKSCHNPSPLTSRVFPVTGCGEVVMDLPLAI